MGPDPAFSPLDFFLNCQQYYVDQAISANRARAVEIARRHDEFGRHRQSLSTYSGTTDDEGGVVFTKQDVREGLLAILGGEVHNQTKDRVWEYLTEMAGDDAVTHHLRGGQSETRDVGITFDAATIERFEQERYVGVDLLTGVTNLDPDRGGSVTPVVISAEG